jgi:hypothetical protein
MKTSGAVYLSQPLKVKKAAGDSYVAITTPLTYSNPTTLPFYVSQQVTETDQAGSYSITITFTGSD